MHDLFWLLFTQQCLKLPAQLLSRHKFTVVSEIGLERPVDRAPNMARYGIDLSARRFWTWLAVSQNESCR
jgi:hypothetical protein